VLSQYTRGAQWDNQKRDEHDHSVHRPDSQNSPDIEVSHIDGLGSLRFSQKQRRQQEAAQNKEEIDALWPELSNHVCIKDIRYATSLFVQLDVVNQHRKRGEESQSRQCRKKYVWRDPTSLCGCIRRQSCWLLDLIRCGQLHHNDRISQSTVPTVNSRFAKRIV
jgi:uncharacterized protein YlbG (UPF0298 family)